MKRIATLTMNPAVDVCAAVERVAPLHKLRCGEPRRDPGGGGINVARVVQRLGGDVTAIYPAGGTTGAWLERRLGGENIASIAVPIADETREDFTALERSTGDQYRFVLPGPTLDETEWRACLDRLTALKPPADVIVASGSLPPGAPDDLYAEAARIAAVAGGRFALDTHGEALKRGLESGVWLVKPSLEELTGLTGRPLDSQAARIAACGALIDRKAAEIVVLTLGAEGALLVSNGLMLQASALPVSPVSAIGAGDSFMGAMIWSLARGDDLARAFQFGVAGGSGALLRPGAELCHADDVLRLVAQVSVTTLTNRAVQA